MTSSTIVQARIIGPNPGPWRPIAVEPQTTCHKLLIRFDIRPRRGTELRVRRLAPHETVEKLGRIIREFPV